MVNWRNLENVCYVAMFLVLICAPLIKMSVSNDVKMSRTENRMLEKMPSYQLLSDNIYGYSQKMNGYFKEQYGFRDSFIKLYSLFRYSIGDSVSKDVIRGKEGWLFYASKKNGDPVADFRNEEMVDIELLKWRISKIEEIKTWLDERGIAYLLVFAPNKHSVYSEYLPAHIRQINGESTYRKFIDYLRKNTGISYIDPLPALLKEKHKYQLYRKTDTHWNDIGAGIVQYEIARKLNEIFSGLVIERQYSINNYAEFETEGGDLARMIHMADLLPEEIPRLEIKSGCTVINYDELKQNDFVTKCDSANLRALIFRDSFFTALQPLVSGYFKEARYVWKRPAFEELQDYVNEQNPDIVIQQFTERYLP